MMEANAAGYGMPAQESMMKLAQTQGAQLQQRPRLVGQIDHLEKLLISCHENTSGIEQATNRLLGSVPGPATTAEKNPPRSSVEQRVEELAHIAEILANRLHTACKRLNEAV